MSFNPKSMTHEPLCDGGVRVDGPDFSNDLIFIVRSGDGRFSLTVGPRELGSGKFNIPRELIANTTIWQTVLNHPECIPEIPFEGHGCSGHCNQ